MPLLLSEIGVLEAVPCPLPRLGSDGRSDSARDRATNGHGVCMWGEVGRGVTRTPGLAQAGATPVSTHKRTRARASARACTHTHTHARARTHARTHTHTLTDRGASFTPTHARTHTHTLTDRGASSLVSSMFSSSPPSMRELSDVEDIRSLLTMMSDRYVCVSVSVRVCVCVCV